MFKNIVCFTIVFLTSCVAYADTDAHKIAKEFGLDKVKLNIPKHEVLAQMKYNNGITFESAFRLALQSWLTDGSHVESPLHTITYYAFEEYEVEGKYWVCLPDFPFNNWNKYPGLYKFRETTFRNSFNDPGTIITLLPADGKYTPEEGETVSEYWIFVMRWKASDHIMWSIVHRNGKKLPYNYGFN